MATIREFVERDVVPVASELEHADEYPTALVETMKELGLFGVTIPEEYGGLGLDLDDVRPHPGRALARLDEPLRRAQHALHLRVDDRRRTGRRSSAGATSPAWPPASSTSPTR